MKLRYLAYLGILIFALGLLLFSYLGIYSRLWSDDWCYNAYFSTLGFVETMKGYTYITTYSASRYALTLFSGLFYYLDIFGVQILPILHIGLLAFGMYKAFDLGLAVFKIGISKVYLAFLAFSTVYYSIYLAPHLYQSFYYRTAIFPYTTPLVVSPWLFFLIFKNIESGRHSEFRIAIASLIALLAGGFSEAGTAYLVTIHALFLMIVLYARKRNQEWAKSALPITVAILCALGVAMILLMASPTTDYRVGLYGAPANLITEFPGLLLWYASDFVRFSFLDLPLPHLVIFFTNIAFAFLFLRETDLNLNLKELVYMILLVALVAFIVVMAIYAPSAYIEKNPPHPRTRIISRAFLTLSLAIVGGFIGLYLRKIAAKLKFARYIFAFILIIGYLYAARSIWITSDKIAIYSQRAQIWDARDQNIIEARESGVMEVEVRGIDAYPVGGVKDFQEKPGDYVNRCGAICYGVDEISATLP